MPIPSIVGHEEIRAALGRARRVGSLPQSILLHGPAGAGKERLGLWLAQLLVCERGVEEPCGDCRACRLTLRLEHPDVHWFFPLPRPDAASPEKLREKLEELRAAELQQWRETPLRVPSFDKAPAHFLAAIRSIQQLASVRPSVGDRKVFVIGDAEFMVPQESSPEAANAFLKLLEEPPPAATVILTSSHPGALLPTIRSRVLSLRVGPLREDDIVRLLLSCGLATEAQASGIARRSKGSLSHAVRLAAAPGEPDPDRVAGRHLLIAALGSDAVPRLGAAQGRRPSGARNDLVAELDSFAEWLRDLAAVAAGSPANASDPTALPLLERAVKQRNVPLAGALSAIERVGAARELALGNVNPQLIVADLLRLVQRDLIGEPAGRHRGSR
jgi:DNA polymerase III subunit delta'